MVWRLVVFFLFFFNDTATTEIYTLSLHDALPIWGRSPRAGGRGVSHAARGGLDPSRSPARDHGRQDLAGFRDSAKSRRAGGVRGGAAGRRHAGRRVLSLRLLEARRPSLAAHLLRVGSRGVLRHLHGGSDADEPARGSRDFTRRDSRRYRPAIRIVALRASSR